MGSVRTSICLVWGSVGQDADETLFLECLASRKIILGVSAPMRSLNDVLDMCGCVSCMDRIVLIHNLFGSGVGRPGRGRIPIS